jgi:hypothetical protein
MVPLWFLLALLEQSELFAQEKILGSQCAARPGNEHEERTRSQATPNIVLKLCVNSGKMERGMNA